MTEPTPPSAWSLALVQDALVDLGLSPLSPAEAASEADEPLPPPPTHPEPDAQILLCPNRPFPIWIALGTKHLRVELRLKENVQRTKLTLWNVIHHNHRCFPFGQFYLSDDGACCFGALLPLEALAEQDPALVLFGVLNAAEGMGRFVLSDFRELPLNPAEVDPMLIAPLRQPLEAPAHTEYPTDEQVGPLLERLVEAATGDRLYYRMGSGDYALAGDCILQVQLAETNPMRRTRGLPEWTVEVRTTVGRLERTDDRLWVMINQWNANTYALGHAVTYHGHAPHLQLATELPPYLLQRADWLNHLLKLHELRARHLQQVLTKRYNLHEPALQALDL